MGASSSTEHVTEDEREADYLTGGDQTLTLLQDAFSILILFLYPLSSVTGSLLPLDLLMLLWLCWVMSWNNTDNNDSQHKPNYRLPHLNHLLLSPVMSSTHISSDLDVINCNVLDLKLELSAHNIYTWALNTLPLLPDTFRQFLQPKLRKSVFHQAWAVSLTLRTTCYEEIVKTCFPNDVHETDENLLYRSSLHGRGLNRFWAKVEGYKGPLLVLIASSSGDAQEGTTDGEKSIVGALTNQGFENKDTFYGTSGSLYALSPVFHAFSSSGKEKSFVYSHLHPAGRVYEPHPKPIGIGFGGTIGKKRIFLDQDFATVTLNHHAADKTYQPGSLCPNQGFLPLEASVIEVEVWGLGGTAAKEVQHAHKTREDLFTEQRRRVDLKTFGNWEDSPEKMMMDMTSNPNAVGR